MIYAVGIRLKYERAFAAGPVTKLGKGTDASGNPYPGGFVFLTVADAARFLAERGLEGTHMIVGVRADWDRDTEEAAGQPYRRLVRDAEAVKL